MVSLRVRKASTLACSRWLARVSFSSSPCSCACWACRSVICCCRPERRVSASRARSSRPTSSAFWACCGELVGLGAELGGLQLDPLAAGGHVGHAAAHLLQQLELPLVGVVEGLPRILQLVQGLVGLGAEDHGDAGKMPAIRVRWSFPRVAAAAAHRPPPYPRPENGDDRASSFVIRVRPLRESRVGTQQRRTLRGAIPPGRPTTEPEPRRPSRSGQSRRIDRPDPQGGRGRTPAAGEPNLTPKEARRGDPQYRAERMRAWRAGSGAPEKALIRDYIDARFSLGEFLLPSVVVLLAVTILGSYWPQVTDPTLVMYVFILCVIVDCALMWRGFKQVLVERMPNAPTKGLLMYGINRCIQIRRFRDATSSRQARRQGTAPGGTPQPPAGFERSVRFSRWTPVTSGVQREPRAAASPGSRGSRADRNWPSTTSTATWTIPVFRSPADSWTGTTRPAGTPTRRSPLSSSSAASVEPTSPATTSPPVAESARSISLSTGPSASSPRDCSHPIWWRRASTPACPSTPSISAGPVRSA